MTAFVLELGRNGYGILRGLARKRVPVVGFYTRPESFGRFSRHCDARQVGVGEEPMHNALVDRAQMPESCCTSWASANRSRSLPIAASSRGAIAAPAPGSARKMLASG